MKAELIKQAYAYGAAVALQELGFGAQDAEVGGVKLAMAKMAEGEEEEGMHPALRALIGGGAGALGGAALGAGSAFIPGLRGHGLAGLVGKSRSVDDALSRAAVSSRGLFRGGSGKSLPMSTYESMLRGGAGAGLGALGGGLAGGLTGGE